MKRAFLILVSVATTLIFLVGGEFVQAANDNKNLVYEGRSLSEWAERALTKELGTLAFREAVIALVELDREAVLFYLQKALKADDARRRYHAILLICNFKTKLKTTVPVLISALKDEDPKVRAGAAVALGRSGQEGKTAVRPLTEALKDKSVRVRVYASAALACIDPIQTQAMVASLCEVLKVGDSHARYYAVCALGEIRSKQTLVPLSRALEDEDEDVRVVAASSLDKLGRKAEPAVPALIRSLYDEAPEVRQKAADALGAIGPGAKAAVPSLTELLQDDEWEVRWAAASVLGAIGAAAKTAERPLTEALEDDNPVVRVHAACALGRINHEMTAVMMPRLIRALQHEEAPVRIAAIGAMTAFGSRARAAMGPLTEALKDSNPLVRCYAAFALKQIDSEKKR